MEFRITLMPAAIEICKELAVSDPMKFRKIQKTLGLLQMNLRHPSLNTHEFVSLKGPNGEKVFEAYVENKTPSAYRIFWHYGPEKDEISVIAITPHP